MKNKGFTLTELLAVIAIIAILSIAAISGYSTMTMNGKEKTLKTKVDAIENAAYKFAKENNIDRKTTISVNKLVVLGYLQADESSDEGLSMYLNPVTGDNMICNTIDLTIANNDVIVKYNTTKKNCSLANEEEDSAKIKVTGYCSSSNILVLTGDTFGWTNCDKVYIRTNPNGFTLNNIESITFDYDGNSIVKKTGDIVNTNYTDSDRYKNIVAVSGIDNQVVTTDVGITYTMKDGKVYFRHVIVRIDKQKPTLTYVLKNNTKIGADGVQERSFEVYVDDANGSGAHGFYVSGSAATGSARYETTDYKKTISAPLGIWYLIPKDSAGNIGEPKVTTVENVPGNLSCIMSLFKNDKRTEVARSNNWYNYDIAVREHSEAYSNGVSYGILKATPITNRSQLPNYANENEVINHFFNPTQTAEMQITKFYGGLWNVQHKGVTVCTRDVGIDKTRPTISFEPNSNSVHSKSHSVEVTITDPGTVVSGFYRSGRDEMRGGSPRYELKYAWVKDGTSESSIPAEKWKTAYPTEISSAVLPLNTSTTSKLTYTISGHQQDYNEVNMTGAYRLIIKADTLQDLAGNYNLGKTSGIFKHDNTPPKCVSKGGNECASESSKNWVNYNLTLTGLCTDQEGTTDQSGCAQKSISGYTYDASGNVSRVQSAEIDSNKQTPGTVWDKAGNSTLCPGNRHTHIDKTAPKCNVTKSPNVTWTNQKTYVYGTCEEQGSIKSGCNTNAAGTSVDTNANTYTQQKPSPGTVTDKAKNSTPCGTISVNIDKIPPTCVYSGMSTSWTSANRDIVWGCSDTGGSQCQASYSGGSTTFSTTNKTATIAAYTIKDGATNTVTCPSKTVNVYVDKTDPYCEIINRGSDWDPDGASFTVSCSDGESGLTKCGGNDGLSSPASNSWRKTGKKESHDYKAIDAVGHTYTCPFTIKTRTRYKKRSWNSCKTGSPNACVGDYHYCQCTKSQTGCDCTSTCPGYSSMGVNSGCKSRKWDDCHHTKNTCKGDWEEWTGYNYSSCTESYHNTDCGSRLEYK